ncbi:MAG: sugar phosphate isomerase/epimerase family protein [Candidatus Hodarchaeota archaeon]
MWNEISKIISYHAVYDQSILDALLYAKENGFAGIQIALETPHLSFENLSNKQCDEIRTFCKKQNIYLTIHGPDTITSLFTYNTHLKKGILSYYNELFTFAEKVDARLITIHLGDYTRFPTNSEPKIEIPKGDLKFYENTLHSNIRTLLELANNRFIICIENYDFNPLILDVLQPYLKQEELWLCWDLPKTYSQKIKKNDEMEKFLLKNIKSVKQIHLHDINSYGKSHKVIGSGVLDFRYFFGKLEISNIMDFCIEVRPREKAHESLLNLKLLLNAKN